MTELFKSLTEQDGEGVLKLLLSDQDLQQLRQNPFHITQSNIKVKYYLYFYCLLSKIHSNKDIKSYS